MSGDFRQGQPLAEVLRDTVLASGRAQVLLARDSGLTPKHVNQMLKHLQGSVEAWNLLLDAALAKPTPTTGPTP